MLKQNNAFAALGGMVFVGDVFRSNNIKFDMTLPYSCYQHISFYAHGIL